MLHCQCVVRTVLKKKSGDPDREYHGRTCVDLSSRVLLFFPKPMGPYRGRELGLPELTFFKNFSLGEQTGKKIQRKKSAITGGLNVLCYLYGDIYLYVCQSNLSTTICVDFSSYPTPIELWEEQR